MRRALEVPVMSDHVLQRGFETAYILHPDELVAAYVTAWAWAYHVPQLTKSEAKRILERLRQREKRTKTKPASALRAESLWREPQLPKRRSIPEGSRFQYCVYDASDRWECFQEEPEPREPRYCPTADDRFVRYIKFLIWRTMDRPSHFALSALSRLLYIYDASVTARVATWFFDRDALNMDRVEKTLREFIVERFASIMAFAVNEAGAKTLQTRRPKPHERELVEHALDAFAPWGDLAEPLPVPTPQSEMGWAGTGWSEALLDWRLAHADPEELDWDYFHTLLDPKYGGLPHLIRTWHQEEVEIENMVFDEPDGELGIPIFMERPPSHSQNDHSPPGGRVPNRFAPPHPNRYLPLIKGLCTDLQHRMSLHAFHRLRVLVDGKARVEFNAAEPVGPFTIPLEAATIAIHGDDVDGEIPLGLVILAELEADERASSSAFAFSYTFTLPLADGQHLNLHIRPLSSDSGEVMAFEVHITPRNKWRGVAYLQGYISHWRKRAVEWCQSLDLRSGRRMALALGMGLTLAVATWWGSSLFRSQLPDSPLVASIGQATPRASPTYQFQTHLQHASALKAWVTSDMFLNEQIGVYGFEPLSDQTLFFHIGTGYAELLALVHSDLLARAAQRLETLVKALEQVKAPASLIAHLHAIGTLLDTPQYSGQTLAQVLATFEPLYEATYVEADAPEGLTFFRLGTGLANLSLAASSNDREALRQGGVVEALQRDLAPFHVSADFLSKLSQLRDVIAQPALSDQEMRDVYALIQTLQRRLGD